MGPWVLNRRRWYNWQNCQVVGAFPAPIGAGTAADALQSNVAGIAFEIAYPPARARTPGTVKR